MEWLLIPLAAVSLTKVAQLIIEDAEQELLEEELEEKWREKTITKKG